HVHACARREQRRPHFVEKDERAHRAALGRRQRAAHLQAAAQVAGAGNDESFDKGHDELLVDGAAPALPMFWKLSAPAPGPQARRRPQLRQDSAYARSKTSTSACSPSRIVTAASSVRASPSPAASTWPLTTALPRAMCTQTRRPAASGSSACSAPSNSPAYTRASWCMRIEPSAPSGEATWRRRPRFSASGTLSS